MDRWKLSLPAEPVPQPLAYLPHTRSLLLTPSKAFQGCSTYTDDEIGPDTAVRRHVDGVKFISFRRWELKVKHTCNWGSSSNGKNAEFL
jgi:hypothetical protein